MTNIKGKNSGSGNGNILSIVIKFKDVKINDQIGRCNNNFLKNNVFMHDKFMNIEYFYN